LIDPRRIDDAQRLLARHFGPTRIARAASLSSPGHDVFLKIETELPTGSFKVRGAIYALSANLVRGALGEVVCASTGNHGAAVAYAARLLSVPATIFLPANPNPVKAARIRELGAHIVEAGADLSAAIDAAQQHAASTSAFFLHDASDPDVPAGTATIGLEIVEQVPAVDVVYVPMGDTALIRGVASAVKYRSSRTRIVGVVAEQAPAYLLSWRMAQGFGREAASLLRAESQELRADVIETETCETIADGLAIRRPLAPNVAAIRELVDDVVAVSEEEMLAAIEWLDAREQVVAEPAGAAATAAFLGGPKTTRPTSPSVGRVRLDPAHARTTVLLVTGRNIAPAITARRSR
jgi:threonine dehydratase